MTEFSHVIGILEPRVQQYGTVAIFPILTLESFGAPLPGESFLIAAAVLAGR
jgi:membrane protein DedA with SNARE-associated domain